MARSGMVVVVMVLAMVTIGEAATDCSSVATPLMPCVTYLQGPDLTPPADCCGGLDNLNKNNPTCLCQLITQLNGSASDSSVNVTKAYNLPKDCAVTLKTSDCPALAGLPLAPPAGVTPSAPATGATPGPSAAAGPEAGGSLGNDGAKHLPTRWVIGFAAAAGLGAINAF